MERTIRLLISYDGSNYHGWQRQRQEMTIQGELERHLAVLCRHRVALHGAGRTDAGVHALGMTAHFHTAVPIPLQAFDRGLNSLLPRDIRVLGAEEVPSTFHSRFSASAKTYRYDFFTGEIQEPSTRLYMAHYPGPFQQDILATALKTIIGTHDFASFERTGSRDRKSSAGRGAVRTLFHACCYPKLGTGPDCWSIRLTGDGFLRQMVRIIAGTLIEIGQGRHAPHDMEQILAAKDRGKACPTAPACGLFLEKIYYDQTHLRRQDRL